jgi:UPF0271 protein
VDLNADVGEGFDTDDALIAIVTSANVACGFHAGSAETMRAACRAAVARGVAIGAHVGYHDLAGFGRRALDIAPDDLANEVLYQIGALDAFARAAGSRVTYVKPHGALYNTAAVDAEQAAAIVDGLRRYDPALALLCLPDSEMQRQAEIAGVVAYAEAFADRAYTADGKLVSRKQPGAVLYDADVVAERAVGMATGGVVTADGTKLEVRPDSLCVHGDTPGAVELARRIEAALAEAGIELAAFTG